MLDDFAKAKIAKSATRALVRLEKTMQTNGTSETFPLSLPFDILTNIAAKTAQMNEQQTKHMLYQSNAAYRRQQAAKKPTKTSSQ
jgi:hypothetical protein